MFCLGGWSPLLPTGFLVSRGTLVPSVPLPLSLTWLSHPAALLPRSFSWIPRSYDGPQPRKSFLLRFGLLPRSLAATGGISFDYFSSGYLDVSVHCVFLYITLTVMSDRHYLPGSPIRTSLDHCSLTAPQSISSLVTSFIGF